MSIHLEVQCVVRRTLIATQWYCKGRVLTTKLYLTRTAALDRIKAGCTVTPVQLGGQYGAAYVPVQFVDRLDFIASEWP